MTYGRTLGPLVARIILGAALLGGASGCGGFNLKVLWAVSEDTPMQAVVRRADVARATGNNVERLMSGTAVDDDSKWVPTIQLKKSDAESVLRDVSADPEYQSLKGAKLKIVTAEAWAQSLSKVCPSESKSPSLLATISPEVHAQYSDIASQARTVAKIKSDIATEEAASDDKDRASEKADHDAKAKELKDKLEKVEADYKPKIDAFRAKLKEDAAKVSPDVKKQLVIAVASLKRAIEDARTANAAALIGYPKAMPGLKDEVKIIVKRIAADTIEAGIGNRPNMDKLSPEVKISGGVSVTIGGLTAADIGRLKLDDAIKDIAERSKNYVVHVVSLLGYIKETSDLLDLQANVLDDTMSAISGDASAGGEDLGSIEITATPGGVSVAATANVGAGGVSGKGGNRRMPVPMEPCVVAVAPAPQADGGDAGVGVGVAAGGVGVSVDVTGKAGAKGAKGGKKPDAKDKKPDPKDKKPDPKKKK